jgi:hypothetical protein
VSLTLTAPSILDFPAPLNIGFLLTNVRSNRTFRLMVCVVLILYNDPFISLVETKHPRAPTQPGSEVWAEIWEINLSLILSRSRRPPAVCAS